MNGTLLEFEVRRLEKLATKACSGENIILATNVKKTTGLVFVQQFFKRNSRSVRISTSEQSGSQHGTEENKQTALLLEQHKHNSVPGKSIGS